MAGIPGGLEPEALEQLRAGLKAMALRALGDPEAADEVAQETLARAVEALRQQRVRAGASLGAFVRGIARHVIADVFRTRDRTSGPEALPETADPLSHDALATLISAQEREQLRGALEQLSAGDLEILHLAYVEGLTPAQIAARLDQPSDRIRKRKSRALNRLREAFLGETPTGHEPA